jgi:hypothetical protein
VNGLNQLPAYQHGALPSVRAALKQHFPDMSGGKDVKKASDSCPDLKPVQFVSVELRHLIDRHLEFLRQGLYRLLLTGCLTLLDVHCEVLVFGPSPLRGYGASPKASVRQHTKHLLGGCLSAELVSKRQMSVFMRSR